MCETGYHVCEKKDLLEWRNENLYIVDVRGEMVESDDKSAFQQMRFVKRVNGWNEKNLRLASAEIVEKLSLPIWKEYYQNDTTLEFVIEVVKRYAVGKATDEEMSAARSAAMSAARSAAMSAARSAARSAAWSAARSAARSAAESAAELAAWSAAELAARSAAELAAMSAARSAAMSAAWSAALDIICKHCRIK
jgi:hypothetical protein